jgi:hypothetical protein
MEQRIDRLRNTTTALITEIETLLQLIETGHQVDNPTVLSAIGQVDQAIRDARGAMW